MTLHRMVELLEIEMECVRRNGCGECNRACHICDLLQDDTELHEMYEEVIARMKAQEPRVMTLHEIDDVINIASEEYKRIFWAEVRSKTRKSFGVFQLDIASEDCYEALLLGCSWPACYRRSTYGIRWRCWTSRPNDEQREATAWDC